MDIQQRLLDIQQRLSEAQRGSAEQKVFLGHLVERTLEGDFGAVLKALTAGRIERELTVARSSGMSSDRILGRLEMAQTLWNDLEQYVADKDFLERPAPVTSGYTDMAEDPEPKGVEQ